MRDSSGMRLFFPCAVEADHKNASALNTLPGVRHRLDKGIKMMQYLRDFCSDMEQVDALLGQLLNPRSYDDDDETYSHSRVDEGMNVHQVSDANSLNI